MFRCNMLQSLKIVAEIFEWDFLVFVVCAYGLQCIANIILTGDCTLLKVVNAAVACIVSTKQVYAS